MRPLKTLPALLLPIILLFSSFPCPALAFRPLGGNALERAWKQYMAAKTHSRPAFQFPFEACFQKAAQQYELPVSLLLAVARGESDFDPKAKSDKNCYGIMQIRWPITAKHLGITTLEALGDPCTNITAGAKYIREMLDRYAGNLHLALAAYNYGPGRISQKASPALIPKGAQWYSGYVHHHLEYILGQTPGRRRPAPWRGPPMAPNVNCRSSPSPNPTGPWDFMITRGQKPHPSGLIGSRKDWGGFRWCCCTGTRPN